MQTKIEELKKAKDKAWAEYEPLRAALDTAWERFATARAALKEAELYEKIRRKVMKDLINGAGLTVQPERPAPIVEASSKPEQLNLINQVTPKMAIGGLPQEPLGDEVRGTLSRKIVVDFLKARGSATTSQIARRLNTPPHRASGRLQWMARSGHIVNTTGGGKGNPAVWELPPGTSILNSEKQC